MNEDYEEPFSGEQIEEWEHDKWLKMQEMRGWNIWPQLQFSQRKGDTEQPFEEEERRKWQKEEEEAKEVYFKEIEK